MLDKAVLAVVMEQEQQNALSVLDRAVQRLSGRSDKEQSSRMRVQGQGNGLKIFEVQFNPASLKIQGNGGAKIPGKNENAPTNQKREQYVSTSSKALSLTLDFEGADTMHQVNGLLGIKQAAVNPCVLFCWGENVFSGCVSQASGEYTMFDHEGQPVRGKVNLTIMRTDRL